MQYKDLKFQVKDHVAIITLDRPKYRNAFSPEMLESWASALDVSEKNSDVRAVILTGGDECFCAGGDVKDFIRPDLKAWQMKDFLQKKVYQVIYAVEKLEKPLIAAINGCAYGAGMDMVLMCDMRIASDDAEFCESYINLGLAPGDGGAYFLPRLVGTAKAIEWLLTGETIRADEALRFGLVNLVVPQSKLMDTTLKLAERIAAQSPIAVQMIKKAVYQSITSTLSYHLDYISSQMALLCETEYYRKNVAAFHEKRFHP